VNSEPLVSIITPSYNQARFLEQTIRSVLDQDYPKLEYIIVDGGSTDGSVDLIQRHADRLAYWVSEKDKGQADAINKGFRHARGEIVAWLNSDDLYLAGTCSLAVQEFIKDAEAALIYGDVLAIDEYGRTINRIKYGDWGLEGLLTFRIIGQPAVFMRRSVLDKVGHLDDSFHFLMDHQLWLRMARVSKIKHVPDTWSAARFHPRSKNIAGGAEMSQEAYRIIKWMQEQPQFADLMAGRERKIMAGAHRLHAYYLLEGGQAAKALSYYGRSLLQHPQPALRDWHRIMYAKLSLFGLSGLRSFYMRWRQRTSSRETK